MLEWEKELWQKVDAKPISSIHDRAESEQHAIDLVRSPGRQIQTPSNRRIDAISVSVEFRLAACKKAIIKTLRKHIRSRQFIYHRFFISLEILYASLHNNPSGLEIPLNCTLFIMFRLVVSL